MLVSFDIDDTLRLHGMSESPEIPSSLLAARIIYREPVRAGFASLARELIRENIRIGIYTTSSRPIGYIRRWMKCYGIKLDLIINDRIHASVVNPRFLRTRPPSKHPGLFGVNLHVDDSEGVKMEGEAFGFQTIIIEPSDPDWTGKVMAAVRALRSSEEAGKFDSP